MQVTELLQPREELISLEYLKLAENATLEKFTQLLEESTIENYVDSLTDEAVDLELLKLKSTKVLN